MVGKDEKSPRTKDKRVEEILDEINAHDAFAILKILAEEDTDIAKRIGQVATKYLSGVEVEDIASMIYFDLDSIRVEELWGQSGETRYGYVDPTDKAWEMFEEALKPYIEELKKYRALSMPTEEKIYCMGILKGIYRFEKRSKSEYKDWATDAPEEYFKIVLDDWKKKCRSSKDIRDMERFVAKNFPDW